jgi:hypothetical protein
VQPLPPAVAAPTPLLGPAGRRMHRRTRRRSFHRAARWPSLAPAKTRAAQRLGMARHTLVAQVKRLMIPRPRKG